jgi:hypothetical protein
MNYRGAMQLHSAWTEAQEDLSSHTEQTMSAEQKEMLERFWLVQESLIAYVSYKATPGTFLLLFAVRAHGWRFGLGGVLELAQASPWGRRLHGTPLWAPQDHFEPTGLRQWNMRGQTPMSRSSHRLTRAARLSPHLHVGAEPAPSRLVGLCQGPIRLGRVLGWHTTSVHGDLGAKEQYRSRPANMHQKHV